MPMPGGGSIGQSRAAGHAARRPGHADPLPGAHPPAAGGLHVHIQAKSYADAGGRRREVLGETRFAGTGGEVLALLAPSGTGKTTILRIVLGLDRDFEGEIRLPQGRLGVMFQEPRLLPWLTVEANLRLVAGIDAREIPPLLAEVGLAGIETLHPKALSLGMARRVALVRALLGRPAMLVLDEPFASLDPKSASELAALLARAAHQQGALVLLSTHDLDPALGCADRLLVLAGTPALLAADWPTGAALRCAGAGAGRLFKQRLLSRFPFLGAEPATDGAP